MNKFEQLRNTGLKVGLLGIVAVGCGDMPAVVEKGKPAIVIETEFIPEHTILVNGMCAVRYEGSCIMYYKIPVDVEDSYSVTLEQCQAVESADETPICARDTITVDSKSFELADNNPMVFYTESGSLEYYSE